MLHVQDVCKEFPTRAQPLVVLRNVSFDLESGRTLAIVGPSGSGKSTLLHILGTLETPTSGIVQIGDAHPFELDEVQQARFRNHEIGFIFQDHHLLPQLSVLENVLLPILADAPVKPDQEALAQGILERVGLQDRITHRPAELSGGERQRAAVARSLINEPRMVLADEPTGNLDQQTADEVVDLLCELQESREESCLVVVTHSAAVADRMQHKRTLQNGELVQL